MKLLQIANFAVLATLICLVNYGYGDTPVPTVPPAATTNATTTAPTTTKPTTPTAAPTTQTKPPTTPTTPAPPTTPKVVDCPPQAELDAAHCLCYPTMHYLICDGTSNTFTFTDRYHFQSLVIKNSPQLPFWNEYKTKSSEFKVDRLVILQETDVKITDNFNELLRLPDEAIKIVSQNTISSLDLAYLSKGLSSISINGVSTVYQNYFTHDYFEDQQKLQHIQFRNVQFNPPIKDIFLQALPLTDVEFVNASLKGKFSFIPIVCPGDNNRITIKLNNNQLTDFNFGLLFPEKNETKDCSYHIELSGNPLRADLLTSQLAILKQKVGKIFLVLRDVQLDCSCDLYKEKSLLNYLHGVNCNTYGYLDLIEKNPETVKKICPPEPAPHTPAKKD